MPVYLERRAQRWPTRYTTCIGICMWFLQCDFIFSSCRCEKWIKKWKEKERMIAICPPLDNRTGHKCTYLDCETMRWSNKFPKSMRHRGALYPSALLLFCSFLCFCFFLFCNFTRWIFFVVSVEFYGQPFSTVFWLQLILFCSYVLSRFLSDCMDQRLRLVEINDGFAVVNSD